MDDGVGSNLWELLKTPAKVKSEGSGFMRRLFGKSESTEDTDHLSKEEIIHIVEEKETDGRISEAEKDMIQGVLRLFETKAKDVMIPRTSVFAVNIEDENHEIIDRIIEERYSRVPVYEKDIDNIIGVLHIKDLFAQIRKGSLDHIHLRGIMREPFFVNEYKSIDEILFEMKKLRSHIAMVIDEYGGFSGIVTIEDLMEEIVGDISDEDDEEEMIDEIQKIGDNLYKMDGFTNIAEVNEILEIDLPTDFNDTVGGLLLRELGKLPNLDENEQSSAVFDKVELKAIKVNDKRIETLILKIHPKNILEL
ncbi:MAG: hemolysin family protein [Peptostreptococcaceae bacterium]|nr:hemolysin family protein [Peptostreptococcaceae bacterium]